MKGERKITEVQLRKKKGREDERGELRKINTGRREEGRRGDKREAQKGRKE